LAVPVVALAEEEAVPWSLEAVEFAVPELLESAFATAVPPAPVLAAAELAVPVLATEFAWALPPLALEPAEAVPPLLARELPWDWPPALAFETVVEEPEPFVVESALAFEPVPVAAEVELADPVPLLVAEL
jgi:hypothetical protein